MLDRRQHRTGPIATIADLLAPGHLSHSCPSGTRQGTAWNRRGIVRKRMASHDRRGRVASGWWRARGGNRPASSQRECEILSAIHGGGFHAGHDSARASPFGPGGVVHIGGRNMLGTPQGKMVGRAGGSHVIVPGGPPMHLTATGTETRRAMVLILHDSTQPPTTPAPDWMPKGLSRG
jgi:hypothetical protein